MILKQTSYYDRISSEKRRYEFQTHEINLIVSLFVSIGLFVLIPIQQNEIKFFMAFFLFACLTFVIHAFRKAFSKNYREKLIRVKKIDSISSDLKKRVEEIYHKYPTRSNGQQFKVTFSLKGKKLSILEESLAVGMMKEGKEVFVTAFMKNNKAVRITATIGHESACSNSDDLKKWTSHIERLRCDQILQYHNHPITNNKTKPSFVDMSSTKKIKKYLGEHSEKLKSYIIFWNKIHEWRVLEYDESGNTELVRWLDASLLSQVSLSSKDDSNFLGKRTKRTGTSLNI